MIRKEFPPNICRLCGLNKSQGTNVYSASAKREGLLSKISKRLSKEVVHIGVGDGLPKFICIDCETVINNFSDFCNMDVSKKNKVAELNIQTNAFHSQKSSLACSQDSGATVHIGLDGKVECILCRTYLDVEHTTLHMVTHGIGTVICMCRACGHQDELAHFIRTNNTGSEVVNTVWCNGCHFLSSSKLKNSTNNKTSLLPKNKSNTCEICSKTFRSPGHLARHCLVHSRAKPFLCEICGTGFSQKSSLKLHVLSHAGINPHKCSHCGQTFRFRVSLRSHVLSMHGSPSSSSPSTAKSVDHECDHCGKQFATAYKLSRHYRSHTGERPYECNICGKLFSQTGNLNLHRKKHEEEDNVPECVPSSGDFSNSMITKTHLPDIITGEQGTEAYGVPVLPEPQQASQQHETHSNNGQYISEPGEVLVNAHNSKFDSILQHPVVPCNDLVDPVTPLPIDTILLNSTNKVPDQTSQFVPLKSEFGTLSTHIAASEYLSNTNSSTNASKPIEHKDSAQLFTHFGHESLMFIDQGSQLQDTTATSDGVTLPTFSSLQSGTTVPISILPQ
ncbi:hypothetical protein L9F63_026389 [Diploptera punctata]|uniref:Uncharacterized protein n=1 Tax=Diploptera punctata TaxID=6984 RepID=A0AAD8AIE3_DIPPU|nr:hypothetical protein L9F63_026389 [Diploptera punctata]